MDHKIIVFFILLNILIRSINFNQHLNFSFDQAWTSTRALEIWRNKEITLVGPGSSIIAGGKQILQGSINYYFLLVFLLLGKFDPVISSYIFMLFSALMSVPLYYGLKYLYNPKVALLILSLYTLIPLYVDFSRFFFGPNYQFTLIPLLVLFIGLYKKTKKLLYLFLIFFIIGVISQFHYATLIFFPMFFLYYLKFVGSKKIDTRKLVIISVVSFLLGFSPIIIFELKNKFYNTVVLWEYLRNSRSLANFQLLPHRYLSFSLVVIIFLAGYLKKYINNKLITLTTVSLLLFDVFLYLPKPKKAFGMSENWNYLMEKKAYEIIRKEKLKDFNIANLIYDNLSVVIKYQMKRDNFQINYDDYYHNKYLFVINKDENIFSNAAYEVNTFKPHKKLNHWKLNNYYNLYLFVRMPVIPAEAGYSPFREIQN